MFAVYSRRDLLTVGSIALAGLTLPDFLHARAARSARPANAGKADGVIFLYLQGAPSHIDLWDPKPDAPAGIRGEFRPIKTSVPGVLLNEVLPELARQAHRFTLIRSLGTNPRGLANHGASIYMLMTGAGPPARRRRSEGPAASNATLGPTTPSTPVRTHPV